MADVLRCNGCVIDSPTAKGGGPPAVTLQESDGWLQWGRVAQVLRTWGTR